MVPRKERVLADLGRELTEKVRKNPKNWLPIFQRCRRVEEHRLRLWHNAGGGGREIARQRSDLIDLFLRELFEINCRNASGHREAEGFTVSAFGGYGRREMNPFSDVDIMFVLRDARPSATTEEIIRQTIVGLWDLGFKVGHSTRSIAEAIKHANEDPISKTAMLESRFLAGDREVFLNFKEIFEAQCVQNHEAQYLAWRLQNQQELSDKYGSSVYMQEPNVKNGRGGLREYQSLLWFGHFCVHANSMSKLVEKKILRDSERKRLDKAYDFLLRVRTEMHYQNKRPIDSLTLQLQGKVATAFNYPQKHILRRCEAFMRDYYSQTRAIARITQSAMERLMPHVSSTSKKLFGFLTAKPKTERFDNFIAKEGKLFPSTRDIFQQDPFCLLSAFQHAQLRQLDFSTDLLDLIHRRLRLVDRTFQYARVGREIFLAILSRKGQVGRILRAMHNVEFLGRYLPEFGALTCLVQHEFYHRYTADEHTLVCVDKLDSILLSEDPKLAGYRQLFQKLEDPSILYLALLLHDTGKAANTRHHEEASAVCAQKVARRLQLSPERRKMLITLVDTHYALSHTAQSRNLGDPTTIAEFASIVQNRQNLDALMLLTLADGMGTSDKSWSDWKESLVWDLYHQTAEYLEIGASYFEQRRKSRTLLHEAVAKKLGKEVSEEIDAHFAHMPERYFQAFEPEQITEHLKAFHAFFQQRLNEEALSFAPTISWIPRPEQGHTEVWVCGWDRVRLFEKIAGAFLSAQIDILSADIYTRGDNLALDIFRVVNARLEPMVSKRDQDRMEKHLRDALSQEHYDFSSLVTKDTRLRSYRLSHEAELPTRITFDNSSHPIYTLVDVQTPNRLGLLYALLRVFGEANVSIEFSRVTTEMDVAIDTFYIHTRQHAKITSEGAIRELQTMLHKAAVEDIKTNN